MLYTSNNDFSGRFDGSGILKADMFIRVQAYINSQKFIDSLALIYSSSTPLLQSERAEAQWNACAHIKVFTVLIDCINCVYSYLASQFYV